MVHRHGRNHCRQVDERRGCPDIDPAYVPGTVWGTASNETARFERGAVPVLCEGQALTAPSTTASRRVPSPRVDTSSHRSAAIAPASSAAASARLIAGFTRIHAAIDNTFINTGNLTSADCRPSRITSTISGARNINLST